MSRPNISDDASYIADALADSKIGLRDYFAAAALSGIIQTHYAAGRFKQSGSGFAVCNEAYAMADAMLAERAK